MDMAVEIGNLYGIIGKDGREYSVEVLGKRVTGVNTDVYVHYEGTDKRLDEWVDVQRLLPLEMPPSRILRGDSGSGSTAESSQVSSKLLSDSTLENSRSKRKIVKDEVALLVESLKPPSRKRLGEMDQDGGIRAVSGHHEHEHDNEGMPRVRNVEWILYAGYDIATWYYSPFPEEYQDCQRLFICEYCLKYIRQVESFLHHNKSCKRKRPPGTVVYSKGINKIYKVDGKSHKLYCQNLSLLAKLFLDNKTLYFDIHGFHFFVLTEVRGGDRADVPVGFFSKEIVSYDGYNLACILILPPFQRKSYGKLLIEFSYELTKIEGKVGSPEKPLSDLGKLGYVSYWTTAILRELYPKPWPAKRIILPAHGRRKSKAQIPTQSDLHPSQHMAVLSDSNADASSTQESMHLAETLSHRTESDKDAPKEIAFSIRELAARTGIMEEDLLETLVTMGWMAHWQSPAEQSMSPAVQHSKRNHGKLVRFYEQQQLLEKFAGSESLGTTGLHDTGHAGHENGGQGHHHGSSSKHHSIPVLSMQGSPSLQAQAQAQTHTQAQAQAQPLSPFSTTHPQVVREEDPIALLEMPESESDDGGEGGAVDVAASALTASGLKDVAVVTLEMVKDYQYRHNIRLDPYVDWNGIDWSAYRSTLDG
ncbi:MAG: acyl-CoA N-acyltransferase [Benniella sp.]|nr:MAG: acyl-CoA N-acyltransferase [Benniella sp.]